MLACATALAACTTPAPRGPSAEVQAQLAASIAAALRPAVALAELPSQRALVADLKTAVLLLDRSAPAVTVRDRQALAYLLELPRLPGPYALRLQMIPADGWQGSIFAPSVMFLDKQRQPIESLESLALAETGSQAQVQMAQLAMLGPRAQAAFMLVYVDLDDSAHSVTVSATEANQPVTSLPVGTGPVRSYALVAARALEGIVTISVLPL